MDGYFVYLLKCGVIDLNDLKRIYEVMNKEAEEEKERERQWNTLLQA